MSTSALAQDDQLLEYREVELEEEGKLTVSGGFETEWHEYNNLDFRPLDETSDQAILDSDDRGGFPYTGAWIDLIYQAEPGVKFVLSANHRGLWGDDQLGNVNGFGGWIWLPAMYVELTPKPEGPLSVRVGRQFYKIGGLGGGRDYVLADTLEMVRVDLDIGIGTAELIPINVISQTDNDGLDFVGYMGTTTLPTFNFRGDTMMRRHGAVLRLDELPGPMDATAYAFYTDVGAGVSAPSEGLFSSGTDISYQGLLGNFTDNDWVANAGVRGSVEAGPVVGFAHFDLSSGIDRKELVARDVDANGYAFGAGIVVDTAEDEETAGLRADLNYFDALGPAYAADGLMFSHGYVGMKGQHVGGMLFNRFLGFHPSAYVGMFGVSNTPHEPSRKTGTRSVHAGAGWDDPEGLRARVRWWMLQDTGASNINLNQLDSIQPPFGYARDEFAAQERAGLTIGQEVNLEAGWQLTETVGVDIGGGLILPGPYYEVVVARVAGDALGSADAATPWAADATFRVDF